MGNPPASDGAESALLPWAVSACPQSLSQYALSRSSGGGCTPWGQQGVRRGSGWVTRHYNETSDDMDAEGSVFVLWGSTSEVLHGVKDHVETRGGFKCISTVDGSTVTNVLDVISAMDRDIVKWIHGVFARTSPTRAL